jgi:hypothetical protein
MLTKSRLAIAAALLLGAASVAQAANDGPQGQRAGGKAVNPAKALHSQASAKPSQVSAKPEDSLQSQGKCWSNTGGANYGWADCAKGKNIPKH